MFPIFRHRNHRVPVQLQIQVVELLRLGTVHLVHPFAHPRLLVKHSAVQAQELDVHRLLQLPDRAHVEHLARSLQIGIVTADHFASAREVRLWQVVKVQVLQDSIGISENNELIEI